MSGLFAFLARWVFITLIWSGMNKLGVGSEHTHTTLVLTMLMAAFLTLDSKLSDIRKMLPDAKSKSDASPTGDA